VNQRRQTAHGRFFSTAPSTIAGRRATAGHDQRWVTSAKQTWVISEERRRRGRGEGVYAKTIAALFDTTAARLGFADRDDARDLPSRFRRPQRGQLSLF
jgi:hypothetical protein